MTGTELLSALSKSGTGADKLTKVGARCGPHTTADDVVSMFAELGHQGTVQKAWAIMEAEKADPPKAKASGEKSKAGSKPVDDKPGDKPPAQ